MNLIQNLDNTIWRDATGKLLMSRPFEQTIIQEGLTFWGSADPSYLTIIDGKVSEAYDIRGTGQKMIQNTVLRRMTYTKRYLKVTGQQFLATATNDSNFKSAFIVVRVRQIILFLKKLLDTHRIYIM